MRHLPLLALAILVLHAAAGDAPASTLKTGDKIVFFGDSITAFSGKAGGFFTVVSETLKQRHPDLKLEFVKAGVPGHELKNLHARLQKEVLDAKATVVVVYIGINDVWHHKPEEVAGGMPAWQASYQELVAKMQAAGMRVVVCTPSVIGEKKAGTNGKDAGLDLAAAAVRAVGTATTSTVVDLRKAFTGYLAANNPEDKPKGVTTGDGVHLNAVGNGIVAREVLAALGEAPQADAPKAP